MRGQHLERQGRALVTTYPNCELKYRLDGAERKVVKLPGRIEHGFSSFVDGDDLRRAGESNGAIGRKGWLGDGVVGREELVNDLSILGNGGSKFRKRSRTSHLVSGALNPLSCVHEASVDTLVAVPLCMPSRAPFGCVTVLTVLRWDHGRWIGDSFKATSEGRGPNHLRSSSRSRRSWPFHANAS